MSEKEPKLYETERGPNAEAIHVNHIEAKDGLSIADEKETQKKNAELARANVDQVAISKEDSNALHDLSNDRKDNDIKWTSKELSSQTYDRTLSSIRNRLKKPEKTFSKVIHQPVVEKSSEVVGATIARPSGILFGGLFSFVGSLLGYLLARRLGGELPYSIFAIFFVGGFVFGIALEFAWYFYRVKKSRR